MFLQTVEGDYLIHLTPYSGASLYVARTSRTSFTVKSSRGDRNAPFVWQLSAWSKGGKGMRHHEVVVDFSYRGMKLFADALMELFP